MAAACAKLLIQQAMHVIICVRLQQLPKHGSLPACRAIFDWTVTYSVFVPAMRSRIDTTQLLLYDSRIITTLTDAAIPACGC